MNVKTLDEFFKSALEDMYNAEKQIIKALPKMAEKADNKELKQGFETHLEETRGQVEKLDKVFEKLDFKREREVCEAMQGLVEEAKDLMSRIDQGPVLDSAMIAAAQKIEHYEIATYGTLCALARTLGHEEVIDLLEDILEEEEATDEKLTKLAEGQINREASRMAA